MDLIVHFETQQLALSEGDELAELWGETYAGTVFRGMDSVRIVSSRARQAAAIAALLETGPVRDPESRRAADGPPALSPFLLTSMEDDDRPAPAELTAAPVDAVWATELDWLRRDHDLAVAFDPDLVDELLLGDRQRPVVFPCVGESIDHHPFPTGAMGSDTS